MLHDVQELVLERLILLLLFCIEKAGKGLIIRESLS